MGCVCCVYEGKQERSGWLASLLAVRFGGQNHSGFEVFIVISCYNPFSFDVAAAALKLHLLVSLLESFMSEKQILDLMYFVRFVFPLIFYCQFLI